MIPSTVLAALLALPAAAERHLTPETCRQLIQLQVPATGCESILAGLNATPNPAAQTTTPQSVTPPQAPVIPSGIVPAKGDCDNFSSAFDVLGSFTNYAFWMTGKDGQMAERLTLHGIYLEDSSQNAEDAVARAQASLGAGESCGELGGVAGAVQEGYQREFNLLTAALKVCAEDVTASKWLSCPDRAGEALKQDDLNRAAGGPLDRYLQAVDDGREECLPADQKQFFEELRLRPCQRGSNFAASNRCDSARYGLATGRLGQLGKVRGLLGKIHGSALGEVASAADAQLAQAQAKLSAVVGDPGRDNKDLFLGTAQAYAAQKMMEPANKLCQ